MHGHPFTIDDNDKMVPYVDKPITLQAAQRQMNAILAGCTTASSIKAFTEQAKRKHDDFFLPKKTAHAASVTLLPPLTPTYENDNHDAFLQHRWNNANNKNKPTVHTHKTKKNRTKHRRLPVTKDDTSVTPTLETLSTLDTRSSHHNENEATLINLTIWNQQVVQYRMPKRPNTKTNRSVPNPSIAVQYALIGVSEKLLNPPKLPCLLPFFNSIICVVLSCFILLADSFTMVKIDDRYPDEWFD